MIRLAKLALGCGLTALLATGCGESGPVRCKVSGSVTYKEKPVPAGTILFEPNASKGNSGPIGMAKIHEGTYETKPGEGPTVGPHYAVISGFDGIPDPVEPDETPDGMPLFSPFRTPVDLPLEATTFDFVVPARPHR